MLAWREGAGEKNWNGGSYYGRQNFTGKEGKWIFKK